MGPLLHYDLTRCWAGEEGLGEIAEEVAWADYRYDYDFPGRLFFFAHLHLGPIAALLARWRLARAIRRRSPKLLGRALHGIQDWHSHGYAGEKHWQYRLGLLDRHPDDWDEAPAAVKERIEADTRRYLRMYAEATAGTRPG
ncbi:MAG: hypothetical protein Kow0056_12550 [Coriobacteriia bacterium]